MRTSVRMAVCVGIVALAFVPLVAVTPAVTASAESRTSVATDFTAGVQAIRHGLGTVTVTGTAPVGTSIEIAGDVTEPVWTEADRNGSWTADVRVSVGEHVIRVTSAVSGRVVDLPVEMLILRAPEMLATVDQIARTIALDGSGFPGAHLVVHDDGDTVGETDADETGEWTFTLRDLAWGDHDVTVWQYFDGAHNGGVEQVYRLSGAATVTTTSASRETERITIAGRAPVGTTLTFADADGPVLGADGAPVRVAAEPDTSWRVELPIPDAARFHRVVVTTHEGDTVLGTTDAAVTIPIALAGTVEELPGGTVRLSGTGEPGATVDLETASGTPITDAGIPIRTTVGRSWEIVVDRDALPADVVVARQRVQGVEQGGLRLVLPALPVRPGTGDHGDGDPGRPGVSSGTFPTTARPASAGLVPGATRLAYTGTDALRVLGVAAVAVLGGSGVLLAVGVRRRRRAPGV